MRHMSVIVGFCCLVLGSISALGSPAASIQAALLAPGKHHLNVLIQAADQTTEIPVTVVTGSQPGPTLLVLAGIHGSEYAPILASHRFGVQLDAEGIRGSILIVHIANPPAFRGRSIYTSPADGLNLNRLFPGKASGSLSQKIAFFLTNDIYPLADAVLDVHSGDANEDLKPTWTGFYATAGSATVIEQSRALAFAFGFKHVVPFQWTFSERKDAIWAGSAAVALGIPAIDVESGGMGVPETEAVEAILEGFHRTLAHLGMTDQTFSPPKGQIIIYDRESVKAPQDGSWVSLKEAGKAVKSGELLGILTDWHGRTVFEARSPKDGILLLRLSAPPVREGETLVIVASTESVR